MAAGLGVKCGFIPKKRSTGAVTDAKLTMIENASGHRLKKQQELKTPNAVFHVQLNRVAPRTGIRQDRSHSSRRRQKRRDCLFSLFNGDRTEDHAIGATGSTRAAALNGNTVILAMIPAMRCVREDFNLCQGSLGRIGNTLSECKASSRIQAVITVLPSGQNQQGYFGKLLQERVGQAPETRDVLGLTFDRLGHHPTNRVQRKQFVETQAPGLVVFVEP